MKRKENLPAFPPPLFKTHLGKAVQDDPAERGRNRAQPTGSWRLKRTGSPHADEACGITGRGRDGPVAPWAGRVGSG
ncbi:MAG TPA: hypothetical protein VF881_00160 [Polyangiaceae bacterium]